MIRIDPRTKLFLMIITLLYITFIPTNWFELIWIGLILCTGILLGRVFKTVRAAVIFILMWLFSIYILPMLGGTLHTSLLVWFGLIFKCFPCFMLGAVVIGTTHISEFMAAMSKMKVPKSVFIPMAILFRYFPVIGEDWHFIKDAMKLRGINPTPVCFIQNPSVVIDAVYVPMLMASSKAADELSVAAITRGIENPLPRSSRIKLRIGVTDILFVILYITALIVAKYIVL
ncbi:energy-coupling factor transporter transmembrane component T [Butyrivibrio sp. NC3005]|uniref:energy-coupling factor transporter transmembrane component T n=1 Tax=Butyrivibrio sp. NC3005 TaxID=1280685 RepID=UPI0003FF249F|nr:energy-coupling factor transporter transmembrane component T [Butyrivibrio sp. NC3005]